MLSSGDEEEHMQPPLLAEAAATDEEYQAHLEILLEWSLRDHSPTPSLSPLHRVKEEPPSPPHHHVHQRPALPAQPRRLNWMSRQGGPSLAARSMLGHFDRPAS